MGKILNSLKQKLFGAKSYQASDDELRKIIKERRLNHIALIPDGDRRWAKEKGVSSFVAHHKSYVELAPTLIDEAFRLGIHTVTLWGPSTYGLHKRSKEENEYLMDIMDEALKVLLPVAQKYNAKIIRMGREDCIPTFLQESFKKIEEATKNHTEHILNFAVIYSGKDEIIRACKKMLQENLSADLLTEKLFGEYLDTAHQPCPDPDLIVRASGEHRMSGFMAWQTAFSELYFPKTYFPDFTNDHLKAAIVEFGRRSRRFGGG
jgi:undecaprenyl diphosphate synthase